LHWFDSNPIIDSTTQALLTSEVFFSCLNRDVPEEKLDLFKFAARCVAEARTSAAQIMGCQLLDCCLLGAMLYDMPDDPFSHAITPGFARPADTPEQTAIRYFRGS
jgi:hypothetical protein